MSEIVNMHEAKTHLSRLAERAAGGEEIIIARGGRPVAKLVPIEDERAQRRLDLWAGEVWTSEDFDDPLPWELQKYFEGREG
jgi:prevent-host-death family protein